MSGFSLNLYKYKCMYVSCNKTAYLIVLNKDTEQVLAVLIENHI